MASKTTAKDIETIEQLEEQEFLQIVDAGIKSIVATHDVNIQKNRYKAMRAIAWQAFVESIEAGDFEALVERASANVDNLPSGWELDAARKPAAKKAAPVKTTPAPKPAAKPAAKAPAKAPVKSPATPKS